MCDDQIACRGLCRAMHRTSNEALAAFLGAALLLVVAFVVTHIDAILQWVGGLAVGGVLAFAGMRWGVPAFVRHVYYSRQQQRPQIEAQTAPERLYRPAPAQPAITPPEVHNHLHIDGETAERLFRP